jgi:hypothetical protein
MNPATRMGAAGDVAGHTGLFFVAALLVLLTSGAFAQSRGPSVFTATHSELRQHLQRKYFIERVDVQPKEHHLYGRTRTLWVDGVLTPPSVAGLRPGTLTDARLMAEAFFREEAALLGLTPTSEMREQIRPRDPTDRRGNIHLRYDHYIGGLRLESTETLIHIRAQGQIYAMTANIAPISADLVRAVNEPTLQDPQIRLLIKTDLQSSDVDPRRVTHLELEKVAIAIPPYVVWKARVAAGVGNSWLYTIDAFRGQILEKKSAIVPQVPPASDRPGQ